MTDAEKISQEEADAQIARDRIRPAVLKLVDEPGRSKLNTYELFMMIISGLTELQKRKGGEVDFKQDEHTGDWEGYARIPKLFEKEWRK